MKMTLSTISCSESEIYKFNKSFLASLPKTFTFCKSESKCSQNRHEQSHASPGNNATLKNDTIFRSDAFYPALPTTKLNLEFYWYVSTVPK